MATTIKQYAALERRIRKGDRAALTALFDALKVRWQFGRKLLKERGDKERLPKGRLEAIYASVGNMHVTYEAYKMECSRRMRLAEQYRTEAEIRAAFEDYGSWSEICARGMGTRTDAAEQIEADPLEALLSSVDGALADAHAALVALRSAAVGRIEVREDDVRKMLTVMDDDLLPHYKKMQQRRWVLLGRWPADRGLLKFA